METFSANGYKQDNNGGWFKYLLLIIMLGLAACFFLSGCNSTKLAKSLHEVKTDSSSHTVTDSTHVINSQNSDNKSKDSVGVSNSQTGSDVQIDFGDTTVGGYLPVTIIQTDSALIINAGGRIIRHITDRRTVSKHDSTVVVKHDSSNVAKHDSTNFKKKTNTEEKKDVVDKVKTRVTTPTIFGILFKIVCVTIPFGIIAYLVFFCTVKFSVIPPYISIKRKTV